jgi:hypothetical protein
MLPWGIQLKQQGRIEVGAQAVASLLTGQTSEGGSCLEGGPTSGTDFIETALLKSWTSAPQGENDRSSGWEGG